jgi:glycosyltransferase 2 family protein
MAGRGRDGHLRNTPVERLRRNLVLALALGVAVYLILAVLSDLGELATALDSFDYALIPAILGLVALSYVVRFLRWTYYLRVLKVSVPTGINAAIFTSGLSMTISPGKLGEVLKCVFVRRVTGVPIARTAPAVIAERATDGTGMVLWGFLGAFALDIPPWTMLIFLALAIVGIAVLRSERLTLAAERVLSRLPLVSRLAPHLRVFHGASNELLGTRPLLVGTALSFFSWGLECAGVYLCAVGLGVDQPFLLIVFVFALSSLVGVLSMLPGGIGAVEAGLYGQFVAVANLSTGVAGALTLVIRLATLWFATLLGICGLLLVRYLLGDASIEPDET